MVGNTRDREEEKVKGHKKAQEKKIRIKKSQVSKAADVLFESSRLNQRGFHYFLATERRRKNKLPIKRQNDIYALSIIINSDFHTRHPQ